MKRAFTMIEIIFVIVVLGILSSIAISKLAVTRDDAIIAKGRAQVAAIRNAISLTRNQQMLQGNSGWLTKLDNLSTATSNDGDALFDTNGTLTILDYPLYSRDADGHWKKVASNKYAFKVMNIDVNFTYNSTDGSFKCNHTEEYCKALTE